ncbi:MAG: hypothetical protein V1787_06070 [Candidatus Micrarchaeota archaeon]
MRAFLLAGFILLAFQCAGAIVVPADDEASFFMDPGEKAASIPLIYQNREYYLILASTTPVALLEREGDAAVPMEDAGRMQLILEQYIRAGFPAVLLVSQDGESLGASLRTEQLRRTPNALRRRLAFVRESELRELRARRDALYAEYNRFRQVNFGETDAQLLALDSILSEMRKSRSLDAAERFSAQFGEKYAPAAARLDALQDISADYSAAAASLAAAQRAVDVARTRLGEESELVLRLQRDLLSAEYDLTELEVAVSLGETASKAQFLGVEAQARAVSRRAAEGSAAPESFWWQASAVIFFLGAVVAGAVLWRRQKGKGGGPEEGVGARILRRIRQFEDKVERDQRQQ